MRYGKPPVYLKTMYRSFSFCYFRELDFILFFYKGEQVLCTTEVLWIFSRRKSGGKENENNRRRMNKQTICYKFMNKLVKKVVVDHKEKCCENPLYYRTILDELGTTTRTLESINENLLDLKWRENEQDRWMIGCIDHGYRVLWKNTKGINIDDEPHSFT